MKTFNYILILLLISIGIGFGQQQPRREFKTSQKPNCMAFGKSGHWLMIGNGNNIDIFQTREGLLVRTFSHHQSNVMAINFEKQNNQVVSIDTDNKQIVWNFNSKKIIQSSQIQSDKIGVVERNNSIGSASMNPQIIENFKQKITTNSSQKKYLIGDKYIIFSNEKEIIVKDFELNLLFKKKFNHKIVATDLSKNGQFLAVADKKGKIQIIELVSKKNIQTFSGADKVEELLLHPTEKLVIARYATTVKSWIFK